MTPVGIGLHIRWHKPTRTYASAYTYVRIGLHVRTHEPARIYVIVSGSVIFCAGIGLVCLLS
ncbi:hypothetical protein DW267_07620 [Bacteroides sp. AM22-3LB]|nr:hypothetical protein DW267_07620 [Bacteroides sp. AM22-3LB]